MQNTLFALLLGLKNLENPLSEDEREKLTDVGHQLKLAPNDWDFIEDELMTIIQGNDALNQLYQQAKAKLDACDRPIPSELLLTDAELEEIIRRRFEGQPEKQSNETLNLTIKVISSTVNVVSTKKQEETAKKSPFLKRLSQFLDKQFL